MTRYGAVLVMALGVACSAPSQPHAEHATARSTSSLAYLRSTLRPWPERTSRGRIAVTDARTGRAASYDSALVVLVLIRRGARDEAARILEALHGLQRPDGSVPFSFVLPRPAADVVYVRSGAVAWVGYAATEYLDAERGGPSRDEALALARGASAYLLARQVSQPGDPRDGLVRGGEGTFQYELDARGVVIERFVPADIPWASIEHNVDSFFFLRALARVTGEAKYAEAAARIATGLTRAWDGGRGQLARGIGAEGADDVLALDCASWGAIFLGASGAPGDRDRAETASAVADGAYASRDARTAARGHRAQRKGPLVESELLMRVLGPRLPVRDWARLEAIWPEGSAGVALAAWRAGRAERARAILDDLEPLRAADGSLPTSTIAIPFLFDTGPSVAGTAWVDLVRFELGRDPEHPTLWVP